MTAIERRDFWESGDADSPETAAGAARRLCVVSRQPLHSGAFIAGLTTSVGSQDELEIIVDRRQGSSTSDPPSVERRRRPTIGHTLERDGFAILPMPHAPAGLGASPRHANLPPPGESEPEEAYGRKLERVLRVKHRRLVRLSRWFIFSVLLNALLFLLIAAPVMRSALRQAPPAPPASSVDSPPRAADSPASPAATR